MRHWVLLVEMQLPVSGVVDDHGSWGLICDYDASVWQ
jgi:hypothetical protein